MKILVAGAPNSGQREVLEKLTGANLEKQESFSGLVLDHKFVTKYFSVECGIWSDEFEDSDEWAHEFCGAEAQEVRDAIALFIFTFNVADCKLTGLPQFIDAIDKPGISLAIPQSREEVSRELYAELTDAGFDVLPIDELVPVVHTSLYDAITDDASLTGGGNDAESDSDSGQPPRELDDIIGELEQARASKTMTKEEKMALAERLADELL